MKKKSLLNFSLSLGDFSKFVEDILYLSFRKATSIVCVANVHMFVEAYKNQKFLEIVNSSDIVTPDGKPLLWALRILYGIKQKRVAGMDLLPYLLQKMSEKNISVFFYGGTEEMLNITKVYLKNQYPELRIAGFHSPPFGIDYNNNSDEKEIISEINNSYPCVVFVVLGCPKQEKWMASMKNKVNAVMVGIGGALPVTIGMQKRAPRWMQNSGLEWFFRLIQEPGRLFKRYATTNRLFIWIILKEFIRVRVLSPLGFKKSA